MNGYRLDTTILTARIHKFTLIISHQNVDAETLADQLYGAGCDDALFSVAGGVYHLDFDREAASLKDAIQSAIRSVESSGAQILRIIIH